MAQRKPSSRTPRQPGKSGTTRPAAGKAPAGKAPAAKAPAGKGPAGRPGASKRGTSIVNQRQTPWGLVVTTVVVIVFAVGIIGYAVTRHSGSGADASNPYTQPEVAAAKAITGMQYRPEPDHTHVFTTVKYNTTPPTGGDHSQIWADCSGTVYTQAIANENATHMLEHGAVWITYRPGLPAAQVAALAKLVNGVDRMAMSPYPGLKTAISLQAWNYQLFVDSASDPRIEQFIAALRDNPKTTPEQASGVTCSDPAFKAKPSTFGHPIFELAS